LGLRVHFVKDITVRKILLLCLLSLSFGGYAYADTIGSTTFDGDLWTLVQINPTTFELTVDTDGSDAENYIKAVAINLGGNSTGGSLASETAPGSWSYVDGGTNSSGCSGAGAAFDCAQRTSGALAYDDGSIYSWTWTILNPLLDPEQDHVKAVYWDSKGTETLTDDKFAGLQMSQGIDGGDDTDITEVPEPATLLLFGTGLAAAARSRKRAKRS
jgi:hypothetical protein